MAGVQLGQHWVKEPRVRLKQFASKNILRVLRVRARTVLKCRAHCMRRSTPGGSSSRSNKNCRRMLKMRSHLKFFDGAA